MRKSPKTFWLSVDELLWAFPTKSKIKQENVHTCVFVCVCEREKGAGGRKEKFKQAVVYLLLPKPMIFSWEEVIHLFTFERKKSFVVSFHHLLLGLEHLTRAIPIKSLCLVITLRSHQQFSIINTFLSFLSKKNWNEINYTFLQHWKTYI